MSLTVKYNQGYISNPENMAKPIGYDNEWLEVADYAKGPVRYKKP